VVVAVELAVEALAAERRAAVVLVVVEPQVAGLVAEVLATAGLVVEARAAERQAEVVLVAMELKLA